MTSKHLENALEFLLAYPLDSIISHGDFDAWAIEHELLDPPSSTERSSDGWKAFMTKRHELRNAINNAAANIQIRRKAGIEPYTIDRIGTDQYHVRRVHVSVITNHVIAKIQSYIDNKGTLFKRFLDITNMSTVSPYVRAFADIQVSGIDDAAELIIVVLRNYERRCIESTQHLVSMVEAGEIPRTTEVDNMIRLLASSNDAEEESEE